MLRFLTPYLIVAAIFTIIAGAAYGAGAIGVPLMYALLFAATLIADAGYTRWDERQHPGGR
jgi:hypothetical protein